MWLTQCIISNKYIGSSFGRFYIEAFGQVIDVSMK